MRRSLLSHVSLTTLALALAACGGRTDTTPIDDPIPAEAQEALRAHSATRPANWPGDYTRTSAVGRLVSLALAADGSYEADTGVRCIRAPCPAGETGRWDAFGTVLRLVPAGGGRSDFYRVRESATEIVLEGLRDRQARLARRVGGLEPCRATGCSGQLCADADTASTCEWREAYACYPRVGVCERQADGACGWTQTEALQRCLADAEPFCPRVRCAAGTHCDEAARACVPDAPAPCRATGCSGQLCADEDIGSTCEWRDEYACYQRVGVCERQADGACGWTATPDLQQCLDAAQPFCPRALCPVGTTCDEATRSCVPDQLFCPTARCPAGTTCDEATRSCVPDSSRCRATGCSGQVCADQDVVTTCEWREEYACYQRVGVCERQADGACGWTQTPDLQQCLGQGSFCARARCAAGSYCDERTRSCLPDLCALPPENGPCRGSFPRWHHDPRSGTCQMFTYGGCGGNANNFETREACERACRVP